MNESTLISSEKEAWDVLEKLLKNKHSNIHVEFKEWPFINLNIKGDRYSSTIPAKLMDRMSNIQSNLNTYYGKFAYNGDARNLKKSDKHEIELLYTVQKGSTDIKADATGLLNKLGEALANPETARSTGITLCVLALITAGTMIQLSQNNTVTEIKRMELLQQAIQVAPSLKGASKELSKTFNKIIAAASDANQITFGSSILDYNEIKKIAEKTKETFESIELSEEYHINSIRRYTKYYLLDITQANHQTDNIGARLLKDTVQEGQLDLLFKALQSNDTVPLTITAKKFEDSLSSVKIISINSNLSQYQALTLKDSND